MTDAGMALRQATPEDAGAIATTTNVRSRQVMEKLGMRHTPVDDFDHPNIAEGHPFRPHVLYRLSRADWVMPAASPGR